MTTLADYIAKLAEFGIFTHYLPFLIVFAIVYAVLAKTKIFGEEKKISGLIALIAALYVMTMGQAVGLFLTSFFAGGATILLFLFMVMLIVGLIVGEKAWRSFETEKPLTGLFLFGIIIAVVLFYLAGGFDILGITLPGVPTNIPANIDQNTLIIIGVLIFTALLIWWMIGGPREKSFLRIPLE